MLDDHGFEIYEENPFPIAYLLTFRTYGTWLHGNRRGSIQRTRLVRPKTVWLPANVPLAEKMRAELKQEPVALNDRQRRLVHESIVEVCAFREYLTRAINVRSNHVHAVVSKAQTPEKIVNEFKSYSTRRLRKEHEFSPVEKIWARGASTRYLWKPHHVEAAVDYVLYSQGDTPFEAVCQIE